MKRILFYIAITATVLSMAGCKKFLEQSAQDLVRPVTVASYKELLQGEGYFKEFYTRGWFVDAMTDDLTTIDPLVGGANRNGKLQFSEFAFKWAKDLENPEGTFTDKFFQHIYRNIIIANTCLAGVDEVSGTEQERNILKGQALFTRAYGYFVLANLYAQAYNEAQPNDLCVPLVLDATPSLKKNKRATINEVWEQISIDITASVSYLADDTEQRSVYEIKHKTALILATRVALYKQEYEKVISLGEAYLKLYPELKNIASITNIPSIGGATNTFLSQNVEVALSFSQIKSNIGVGGYLYYSAESISSQNLVMGVSADGANSLIGSYGTGDRRKNYWFAAPTGVPGQKLTYITYSPMKFGYYDRVYFTQNLRTAEVYLNLAEAYVRQSSPSALQSIGLLNQLRSKRIVSYVDLTTGSFSSNAALLKFVLEERRRELCFEEFHRWWDLRRTGQPAIKHSWLAEQYELKQKDAAYVLNFPADELDYNNELVQNIRPVRLAN